MDVPLYFYVAYEGLDRLSPGSDATTLKAIEKIGLNDCDKLNILDIACGVGSSTVLLAKHFKNSTVEAFDLFRHYIDALESKIQENHLENRVFAYVDNMNDPDFANEEFDIVFCEAAADIIGFKNALSEWKRLVKPGGYMVISSVSWISKPTSQSVRFWKDIYDDVDFIDSKISQIGDEDLESVDYVTVSKKDWKDFHLKLEKNISTLNGDKSAEKFKSQIKKEIEHYRRYGDDYSYVFYIMRKH